MTKNKRNYWYWSILYHYNMNIYEDFFELKPNEIYFLEEIANAIRCKGENGKSPARTLWNRAKEGRPF